VCVDDDNPWNPPEEDLMRKGRFLVLLEWVSEKFSPLLGIDATWNFLGQGLITKVEFKKDRNASLALSNQQVTEIFNQEWTVMNTTETLIKNIINYQH
jgi:hypothetical protein